MAQRTHNYSHLQRQEVYSLTFFFADSELNIVPSNIGLVESDHGAINVTSSHTPTDTSTGSPATTLWGVGISTWLPIILMSVSNFGSCMRTRTYSTTPVLRNLFRRDSRSGVQSLVVEGYSLLRVRI